MPTKVSSEDPLEPWLSQALIDLIANYTGLNVREDRREAIQQFVLRRTEYLSLASSADYYRLLQQNTRKSREEWGELTPTITNSESFFFRDKGQFKLLKRHIFPGLIRDKAGHKSLRICSAGCSTGEEPYSIAILLREMIPDIENWSIKIIGLDINGDAIEKAKTGIYRPWSFRGLDKAIIQRFFDRKDDTYQLQENIRRMVSFHTFNLFKDTFLNTDFSLSDMDLIVCRNVFIYFNEAAIEEVIGRFHDALCPTGYLLVGHSELYSQNLEQFRTNVFEESIAYQRHDSETSHSVRASSRREESLVSSGEGLKSIDRRDISELFDESDFQMQEAALKLLQQLPQDTRISRLGDRTVAELILQLEKILERR
jgi:chemotaxis protein methyltransferase CheR